MPKDIWWPWRDMRFLMSEVTLYPRNRHESPEGSPARERVVVEDESAFYQDESAFLQTG